jgi:hypothetical protein
MVLNDGHHPFVTRVEGDLKDFLVLIRKKW